MTSSELPLTNSSSEPLNFQQSLTLQNTADALGDAPSQLGELAARRRLHPAESERAIARSV